MVDKMFERLSLPVGTILAIALCIGGASGAARADGQSVDYTLRWQAENLQDSAANDSQYGLYTLNSLMPGLNVRVHNGDDFHVLPNGISWLTRASHGRNANSPGTDRNDDDDALSSREYRFAYSRDFFGVSLAYEHFESESGRGDADDTWKLGVSTGGRITSLGWVSAPVWQLSVHGQYVAGESDRGSNQHRVERGDWYLSPSLHWSSDNAALSAGIEMPLDIIEDERLLLDDPPDYRLRANFLRRF